MGLQQVTNKVSAQNATEAKPDKGVENALKLDNDSLKAVHKAIMSSGILVTKSVDRLGDILMGNDLQKAEDQQEMIDILKGLKPEKSKDGVKNSKFNDKPKGIFDWLKDMLAGLASIPIVAMFTKAIQSLLGALGSLIPTIVKNAASVVKNLLSKSPEMLAAAAAITLGIVGGLAATSANIGKSFAMATKGGALESFGASIGKYTKAFASGVEGFALNIAVGLEKLGMKKTADVFLKTFVGTSEVVAKLSTAAAIGAPIIGGIIEGVQGFYQGVDDANKKGLKGTDRTLAIAEKTLDGFSHGVISWSLLGLLDVAKSAMSTVAGWFGADETETFLDSFSITDVIVEAAKMGGEFIGDVVWKVWDGLMGIVEWFQDYGPERMIDGIVSWWKKGDFINGIQVFFSDAFKKIGEFFTTTIPEIAAAVSDWWKDFDFVNTLTDFASAAFKNVKAFFGKVFDSVTAFFTTGWAVVQEMDKQINQVLEDGIKGVFKIIIDSIKFLLNNIPGLSYLISKIPGAKGLSDKLSELSPDDADSSSRVSDYEKQKQKESRLVMLKQERENLNQLAKEQKDAQASAPMIVTVQGGGSNSSPSASVSATQINVSQQNHPSGSGMFTAERGMAY